MIWIIFIQKYSFRIVIFLSFCYMDTFHFCMKYLSLSLYNIKSIYRCIDLIINLWRSVHTFKLTLNHIYIYPHTHSIYHSSGLSYVDLSHIIHYTMASLARVAIIFTQERHTLVANDKRNELRHSLCQANNYKCRYYIFILLLFAFALNQACQAKMSEDRMAAKKKTKYQIPTSSTTTTWKKKEWNWLGCLHWLWLGR